LRIIEESPARKRVEDGETGVERDGSTATEGMRGITVRVSGASSEFRAVGRILVLRRETDERRFRE
jgi:hypothetical protein